MATSFLVVLLTLNIYTITNTNGALTTETINTAHRKNVVAEKTCGAVREKYYKVSETELPPMLRYHNFCDASNPDEAHNATNLVDGDMKLFWQTTAMVNRANITIDLTGPIHKV